MPLKPKFALVSWLEEGSVGIMPLTAARDRDKLHVGAIVPMKFQGKYYDAEILKISGKNKWMLYCMIHVQL